MNYVIDAKAVGARLRELRGDKSRKEVADAIGVCESSLMYYETGERTPRDRVKVAIAKYYGKSIQSIFFSDKPTL